MGFIDKVKSFFEGEDYGENYGEDYGEGNSWIDVEITVMTPYTELIKIKEGLKPFAEELDWDIESGNNIFTDVDKIKRVNVTLSPKGYGKLTPEDYLEIKDKMVGLTYAIHKDLLHAGDHKKASKDFKETINITYTRMEGAKPKKMDWIVTQSASFMTIRYPLVKRINLEKKDKEKALEIFGKDVESDIKSIFTEIPSKKKKSKEDKLDKQLEESSDKMKEELRDLFGFDI